MVIREAERQDLQGLLELYLCLHETIILEADKRVCAVWERILADPGHHVIVAEEDGRLVSSCVCVVVPNLTRGARPYALIENVVTHERYRGRGHATACLHHAASLAREEGCYKLMLLTGAKDEATLNFYRRAGYSSGDKTAFVQWL